MTVRVDGILFVVQQCPNVDAHGIRLEIDTPEVLIYIKRTSHRWAKIQKYNQDL